MLGTVEMDTLFVDMERDLRSLEALTAQSLVELDADASAALSRWMGNWELLDELASELRNPDHAVETASVG